MDADDLNLLKLNALNPVYYLQNQILSGKYEISSCTAADCSLNNSTLLIIAGVVFSLISIHHLSGYYIHLTTNSNKKVSHHLESENSKLLNFFNFLLVNLLDLIFKIFSIFIFYVFFNKIFVSFYFNTDIVIGVLSILFLLFFTFYSYFHAYYILLFMRIDSNDSLHYDNFSKNYDLLLLIIKIIIGLNKNLILINNNDAHKMRLILALDYLLIFCIFNYTVKMILNIVNDKNLNIVTNFNFNLFRLFNTIFLCVNLIIYLFFNMPSVYEIILTTSASIFIASCLILYMSNYVNLLIYKDEKMIYQFAYLLSYFLQGESKSAQFEKTAIKAKAFHNINCKNQNLNKCKLCRLEEITITKEVHGKEKINLLTSIAKYIQENTLHNLNQEEYDFFNLINLIFEYNLTLIDHSLPRFNVIYKTKEMLEINRENKNNLNYFFNLIVFYAKINQQKEEELNKFNVVKNYDTSLFSLKKSIEIIKDIVDTLDSRVKKDLYPQTTQLNNLKLQILKNLEEIHSNKKFYNDNLSFIMTKYIFEKTFNLDANSASKILENSEDFDARQDLIADHFNRDKILIIKYENLTHSLTITRASKDLCHFQGKYLEEIFPSKYRDEGKQKFIHEILNKENFTFEFLLETSSGLNEMKFIQNINLKCKIFRSPDLTEIFILSHFEISQEDFLVFETPIVFDRTINNLTHDMNKSSLSTFSKQLEKILLIDPMTIESLLRSKLPKKNLLFNDLFRRVTLNSGQNKNNATSKNDVNGNSDLSNALDFILNYRTYYNNFFIEIENNLHSLENDDLLKNLEEAKSLRDSNYAVNCRLNLKFVFKKNDNTDIFVFSFKNFSTKNKLNLLRGTHDDNLSDERRKNRDDLSENNLENYNKNYASTQSVSSVNGASSALKDGLLSTMTFNGKKSNLDTSDKKMANFTITTLLINFCLGLYCIFFLFMGFQSNNKMKELNLLKTNFNNFERMFYQTALSQFYNVGVYKKGTTYMDDYLFGGYWDQFKGTGLSINMGDYANSELFVKTDLLKRDMGTLQNYIYDSTYKNELDQMFNFNTDYNVLYTSEGNELKLQSRNPNFFETILMFMNNAKASVFYTTNTMIYIHNYDLHTSLYDFSSVFEKKVTNVQKAVYEAIFNFPVYLNNLNKIWKQVQDLYYSEVDSIFQLNLYLTLTLIGLHIFLLVVSFAIISFLKKTTSESNYIYSKVVTGEWTNYLTLKLHILKEMINFYKIDPIKNSSRVRKELRESAKIMKEKQEKEDKLYTEITQRNEMGNSQDAQIVIGNLISPLRKTLFYLFTFYLIYAFSFIIIFNNSKSDIILTTKFASAYLQVDKGIMNSILLLQCILFSNQTDYSLNQYMKNHTTFISDPEHKNGYIWDIIEEAKLSRTYISFVEKNYPKFAAVEHTANTIAWCDNLFFVVDDDVFAVTKKAFPGNTLLENLSIVCKHYPVMGESYYTNIIEEINYIAAKMVRSYLHSYPDYTMMKKTNDETEFFDEFTIAVMIIRPIQSHLLKNDIANLTKSTEDNFVMVVIIFMIGNILVECLIFFVINRMLIRRVLVINDEIRCLTLCLTA
jgi:hypothetical protein